MTKLDLFICARGNSKGIPKKNLQKFGKKTLVERAVKKAKDCSLVKNVYVSSESNFILSSAINAKADYVHQRKSLLSEDNIRQVDVVNDLLRSLKEKKIKITKYAVLLQTTIPFLEVKDLEACIEIHYKMKFAQVISGSKLKINPCEIYLENKDKEIVPLYSPKIQSSQRQLQPDIYRINGGIRIFKVQHLILNNSFFDKEKCLKIYEMDQKKSLNLDEMADWDLGLKYLKEFGND